MDIKAIITISVTTAFVFAVFIGLFVFLYRKRKNSGSRNKVTNIIEAQAEKKNAPERPESIEWEDILTQFGGGFDSRFTAKYPYYKCVFVKHRLGMGDEDWTYLFMSHDETELLAFSIYQVHLGAPCCVIHKSVICEAPIDKKTMLHYADWVYSGCHDPEPVIEKDGTLRIE